MWITQVWVPGKGWKDIGYFREGKDAVRKAIEFLPLEVQVTNPDGRTYKSGWLHLSDFTIPSCGQVERLANELGVEYHSEYHSFV